MSEKIPYYASIDWSTFKKWQSVKIPMEDVGGYNGISLMVKYAARAGVDLEWLEYADHVKFIVAGKIAYSGSVDAIEKLAWELLDHIEASYPDSISSSGLRNHYSSCSYSKFKKALDFLIDDGKIKKLIVKGPKGRPSYEYIKIMDEK